jgi:NAD(P)H-nitrite reductase large subunit
MHSKGAGAAFKDSGRIVIVGASLAGLRAAETLRAEGFCGHLTLIGDEPYLPYDRPPLTKAVLTGWVPAEHTQLPRRATLTNVEWRLGVAATDLDCSAKQVRLADGQSVGFDRVLIATGTRARPWFDQAEGSLEGVFTLRSWGDAKLLHQCLAARPRRVLVIGGGFTGSEPGRRLPPPAASLVCRSRWSNGGPFRWWGRLGECSPIGSLGCSASTGSIYVVR